MSKKYLLLLCVLAVMAFAIPLHAGTLIVGQWGTAATPGFAGWTSADPLWSAGAATAGGGQTLDLNGNGTAGLVGADPSKDSNGTTGGTILGYNRGGNYANSLASASWVTSGAINCAGLSGVHLTFKRWLNVEDSRFDTAEIQVSSNGTTWTSVWKNPGTTAPAAPTPTLDQPEDETLAGVGAWQSEDYDIHATADGQATVYIRFGMGPSDSMIAYGGWNIDDIIVTANTTAWTAGAATVPTAMAWEETANATFGTTNSGEAPWNSSFVLRNVILPTEAIVRWGVDGIPVAGTVAAH